MPSRSTLCVLAVLVSSAAVTDLPWSGTVLAQTPIGVDPTAVESLLLRIDALEDELRDVRQQQSAMTGQVPETRFEFASTGSEIFETSGPAASSWDMDPKDSAYQAKSCKCGRYPCQCQLPLAPCIDCPRVSTLRPFNNLNIYGAMKLDMIFSNPRPLSPGVPFFLSPGSDLDQQVVSIHARQSTVAAAYTGPQFGGFQSGGVIVALFFNDSVIADQYGLLPLQAFGELRNDDWRFAAGLMFDVFSPGIPTVLPFSALAASGNSGNSFRGQMRLERFLHPADDVQWTLQFALSEPITSTIDPTFRVSEDNGWPNVEARAALGLGQIEGVGLAARRPFQIGVSGVVGQLRTGDPLIGRQVVADVWGLGADVRWKIGDCWGIAGEVYTGETLGTYNAGVLQNVNLATLEGIRSSGGWLETFVYWTPCLHSHIGFGIDDPLDRDISVDSGRTYNSTLFSNLLWDVNEVFRIGFEFTYRKTEYKALRDNEGTGFHTQFQWSF